MVAKFRVGEEVIVATSTWDYTGRIQKGCVGAVRNVYEGAERSYIVVFDMNHPANKTCPSASNGYYEKDLAAHGGGPW